MQPPHAFVNGSSRRVRRLPDARRCVAMSTYAFDRAARFMRRTAMSFTIDADGHPRCVLRLSRLCGIHCAAGRLRRSAEVPVEVQRRLEIVHRRVQILPRTQSHHKHVQLMDLIPSSRCFLRSAQGWLSRTHPGGGPPSGLAISEVGARLMRSTLAASLIWVRRKGHDGRQPVSAQVNSLNWWTRADINLPSHGSGVLLDQERL
jgi:hypothetical protein